MPDRLAELRRCAAQVAELRVASLAMALLVALSTGALGLAEAADEQPAPSSEQLGPSGTKYVVAGTDGAALRVREKADLDATIVGRLPEGALVTLTRGVAKEADGERWLPVKSDAVSGWVAARYLRREMALASIIRTVPADAPFGDRVAATAERALGQPYVWGGTKPGGFDCSGFAQWVYTQVGLAMPRLIPDQLALGKSIDRASLQVGDLVAFKDTYQAGLSHVGIYLGGDRFIHAADEAQGVTISNLADGYWKPRFAQAARPRP